MVNRQGGAVWSPFHNREDDLPATESVLPGVADVLECLPVGAASVDRSGRVKSANAVLQRMLGYDRAALLGQTLSGLLAPGERPELPDPDADPEERRLVDASGAVLWAGVTTAVHGTGLLVFVEDRTALKAAEENLAHQVLHDPLTGLPNRTLLMDRLAGALGRARRSGGEVSVLFLDLDRFKLVNDGLGHEVGDELLSAVGGRILGALRAGDTVARLGGDEFVVLCEGRPGDRVAEHVAARVHAAVAEPHQFSDQEVVVTVSIGIARGLGDSKANDLLRDADAAMYEAKDRGRARSEVFSTLLHHRAMQRLEAERALRQAVEGEGLRLHFQPIVELATGELRGVEALVRQELPDGRLLPPQRIVPLAEETGLILPLGRWTIAEALRCARRFQKQRPGRSPLSMSVNVSPLQLADPGFATDVADLLAWGHSDPRLLTLEITESAMAEDLDRAVAQLQALAEIGVRLAIDDFGTGYSSLNLLRRLPIDVLKVDKSFVDQISASRTDAAVVAAIVELAGVLGLEVIAEGIEEAAQVERLLALFCRYGQGFHFARPLCEEAAERFVSSLPVPTAHRGVAARPELWGGDHVMQFYESDEMVVASILEYAERGLAAGEAVVVVVTDDHRTQLEERFAAGSFDFGGARGRGQLQIYDAATMLSRFMVGGLPDAAAFDATVGKVVADARAAWGTVRVFGEMVGTLWGDGQVIGSIRLEELWNELGTRSVFKLLCAYALPAGASNVVAAAFGDICAQHALVERAVSDAGS